MRAVALSLLPLVQLVLAIQPSAPAARPAALRQLKWGKLNFLQTTDTHGWHAGHLQEPQYSADWGDYYSFTVRMREHADEQGVDLLIVDTGDRIEGSGLSDASNPKGKYIREIFSTVDMDVVTIGNHELYKEASASNEYLVMRPHYKERYVVSNVDIYAPDTGELVPLGNRFRKFTTKNQGIRVTAFAFLFDFTGNFNNTVVYPVASMIQEEWFIEAITDPEVDVFVIIGHTPVRFSPEFPAILAAIRKYQPDIPVQFLGGHTHIRDFAVYDDLSTGLESGRYCETVGFVSLSHIPKKDGNDKKVEFSRSYIDFNRFGFQQHSHRYDSASFDTKTGLELSKRITKYRSSLGLDKVLACAPQDYYMDRVPYPHPNSLYSLLSEQILPDMVYNPERKDIPTFIFINTGSQRFDIFKGQFTTDTSYYVSPFTSTFRYLPDIPYAAAKKLIRLFNRSNEPWMLLTEEDGTSDTKSPKYISSIPPISPLEQYYHSLKLANNEGSQSPHMPQQQQIPLAGSISSPHHHHSNSIKAPGNHEVHLRPAPLTPGYMTYDDFGADGDDTPHEPIVFNSLPKAVVGNRSMGISENGNEPKHVDVVFLDFIEQYILAGLRVLGEEHTGKDSKVYMPKGAEKKTMTEMMVEWMAKEWNGKC